MGFTGWGPGAEMAVRIAARGLMVVRWESRGRSTPPAERESEFFIDHLLVRIHYIIVMIKWTGLVPWEFEFPAAM